MTPTPGATKRARRPTPTPGLEGLEAALADVVCWLVFYLQRAGEDEVDPEVATELLEVVGDALGRLPVADRLRFLHHAANRSVESSVEAYQNFLLDVAESLGLE